MGTFKDLTGKTFNRLTVLEQAGRDKFGKILWKCRCSCGRTTNVSSGALVTGNTKSCGCYHRDRASESNFIDLTGKRFGRLTVIKRVANSSGTERIPSGKTQYECLCDCGKTCVVKADALSRGDTKSCGCLNDEKRKLHVNNLTGQKFGRLTVIERVENCKFGKARWRCKCDCGNETVVTGAALTSGHLESCGCLRLERLHEALAKWTPEERELLKHHFTGMIQRCYNPNNPEYSNYGGRGIKICDEWLDPVNGRRNFVDWAFSHGYSPGLTIERNDVNGNYCPENCSWISRSEQAYNQRRSIIIEVKGHKMHINKWSDLLCFPRWCLRYRYRKYGIDNVKKFLEQYV